MTPPYNNALLKVGISADKNEECALYRNSTFGIMIPRSSIQENLKNYIGCGTADEILQSKGYTDVDNYI